MVQKPAQPTSKTTNAKTAGPAGTRKSKTYLIAPTSLTEVCDKIQLDPKHKHGVILFGKNRLKVFELPSKDFTKAFIERPEKVVGTYTAGITYRQLADDAEAAGYKEKHAETS